MAKAVESGSQVCSDGNAAACLAQGNPKCKAAPIKAGMTDQNSAGTKYTTAK